jgi:hypothetical protein
MGGSQGETTDLNQLEIIKNHLKSLKSPKISKNH